MRLAVVTVLYWVLGAITAPSQGHKSTNAMHAIRGIKGGGLQLALSPGQAKFGGGDIIRALGLNLFIGDLYLQPVTLGHHIGQGRPGPASLGKRHYAPTFHIKSGSLYQLNNETSVLYASVIDVAFDDIPVLQLQFDNKKRGVNGRWEWHDTTLHFQSGGRSNMGLFHACRNTDGSTGIYIDFELTWEYPENCVAVTLHSLGDEIR